MSVRLPFERFLRRNAVAPATATAAASVVAKKLQGRASLTKTEAILAGAFLIRSGGNPTLDRTLGARVAQALGPATTSFAPAPRSASMTTPKLMEHVSNGKVFPAQAVRELAVAVAAVRPAAAGTQWTLTQHIYQAGSQAAAKGHDAWVPILSFDNGISRPTS